MTYETDRGVFFDPDRVRIDKCLKCATPTSRRSPRRIASLVRDGALGPTFLRSRTNVLTLCETCDARWTFAIAVGFASFVPWIGVPILAVMVHLYVVELPSLLFLLSFFLGVAATVAGYVYALRKSIRVRAIDDDGLLGLDNIHPEVRSEIVAAGLADPS
jgi:hypothetical protein